MPSPIPPAVIMAKKGKKKLPWRRAESDFHGETNIFPGGTAIDPDEMDAYLAVDHHIALTRPGTAA